jgi:opacity protein-like surface antigen
MKCLNRIFLTGIIFLISTHSALAENVINVKVGKFSLDETQQTPILFPITLEEDSSGALAVEYEWRAETGFAFGGELVLYNNSYTTAGGSGDADSGVATFNVKNYFNATESFKPFIGGGIGFGVVSLTGTGNHYQGDAAGLALQLMVGAEFRVSKPIGLYAEYKYISSETEDFEGNSNAKFDISGSGLFVGVSVHF